jgi:L-Ala-D/L-Glu epimerase
MEIRTSMERWPLARPFRITGYTMHEVAVLVVTVSDDDGSTGRGEAAGVYYRGDEPKGMATQLEEVRLWLEEDGTRAGLRRLLPAGGARNALDCALWDLEAQQQGRPVWQLASLDAPRPLLTTYTLGADDPPILAARAREVRDMRALKLKLTGDDNDADRVRAVREARPDVWLGVDANQGFTPRALETLLPVLVEARVELIEQPFPVGREADLDAIDSPIPIAADESVQGVGDLAAIVGRFDVVNIKLDKCGGLTEALDMVREARKHGLGLMVGNMVGTSLAMAPAFLVGQACEVVDLDGPLLLASDRTPGAVYSAGQIWCGEDVWGGAP